MVEEQSGEVRGLLADAEWPIELAQERRTAGLTGYISSETQADHSAQGPPPQDEVGVAAACG